MLMNRIVILVLIYIFCLPIAGQAITISQSLNKFEIAYEDSLLFEIYVEWQGPPHKYLFNKPLYPQFTKLKAGTLASSISTTGSSADEITTKKFKYVLYPAGFGQGTIEPINIAYLTYPDSTEGELVTELMAVTIAQPIPVEKSEGINVFYIILPGLGFLMLAGAIVVLIKKKQTKKLTHKKSPKEIFLEKLAEIKKNSNSDLKEFQKGLYNILIEFISSGYSLDLTSAADDEIMIKLNETKMSEIQKEKISGWLIKARKDKYQPVPSAPGDTIRLESDIRNIFENI